MHWKNISIFKKLTLGFCIIVIAGVLGLGNDYKEVLDIKDLTSRVLQESNYRKILLEAEVAHLMWVNKVADFLITNGVKPLNVTLDDRLCTFGKLLYGDERKVIEELAPETAPLFLSVEEPHRLLHQSVIGISKAVNEGKKEEAVKIFETVTLNQLATIQSILKQLMGIFNDKVLDAQTSLIDTLSGILNAILIFACSMLVGGILLSIFIGRGIVGPIWKLVSYAKEVSKGNLQIVSPLDQKDEIGQLSEVLLSMVHKLKQTIEISNAKAEEALYKEEEANISRSKAEVAIEEVKSKQEELHNVTIKLKKVVDVLTKASQEISIQAKSSENGAIMQAKRISETATAMSEMTNTILEVAKNASEAADLSTEAKARAEEGSSIMGNTVRSIHDVQDHSLTLKEEMQSLTRHAQNIDQIMSVISDIADQTNLLALNAAIEAARAGEAGRGFAVVADEVRKLAEKTITSTSDVGKVISSIQQSVDKNMGQVDKTVSSIKETTALSAKTGEILNSIRLMVESIASQIFSIATASEEQSSASEEITSSIEEVNKVAAETAAAMAMLNNAMEELTTQSHDIKLLIQELEHTS